MDVPLDIINVVMNIMPDCRALGFTCHAYLGIYYTLPDYKFWRAPRSSKARYALPKMRPHLKYTQEEYVAAGNSVVFGDEPMTPERFIRHLLHDDVDIVLDTLNARANNQFPDALISAIFKYHCPKISHVVNSSFVRDRGGDIASLLTKVLENDSIHLLEYFVTYYDCAEDLGVAIYCAAEIGINTVSYLLRNDRGLRINNLAHKILHDHAYEHTRYAILTADLYLLYPCLLYSERIAIPSVATLVLWRDGGAAEIVAIGILMALFKYCVYNPVFYDNAVAAGYSKILLARLRDKYSAQNQIRPAE